MGCDSKPHHGELHDCWECKLVNMLDAIRDASDSQLIILNQAISKWKGRYYSEAVKAATARARVLELKTPSTTALPPVEYHEPVTTTAAHPLADPVTGKLGLNKTPWVIRDKVKHFVDCEFHQTRMTQKKGINKNKKPYCRFDCPIPGCDVGAWFSDIFPREEV